MFQKILVPLDGSEHSMRALQCAISMAAEFHGKITLIHVYSVAVRPIILPEPTALTPSGVPVATAEEVSKVAEAAREAGNRILAEGAQKVSAEGVEVESLLREGHAAQEIVKAAKEGGFDLVVIGARGISKIREILLGSVSDEVIRHSSCPVLIVK